MTRDERLIADWIRVASCKCVGSIEYELLCGVRDGLLVMRVTDAGRIAFRLTTSGCEAADKLAQRCAGVRT